MAAQLLLIVAAFAAGVMNSVAGGGSFLTFPALVFTGIPSVAANATSTVAIFPAALAAAWAYRHDFPKLERIGTPTLLVVSIVGGGLGALLLIFTPEHTFNSLVPWLLLMATILFAAGKRMTPILMRYIHLGPLSLCALQFVIAVYGGYFGGAIGIMMLALFGLFGLENINSMNALKSLLAGTLNGVAVICFIIAGAVRWEPALIMLVSSVAGGYIGARVARKMNPDRVRAVIITIGVAMTAAFFWRQ
jgi:uncharacterized membrane protein YfcA